MNATELIQNAEDKLTEQYKRLEEISLFNQRKVLNAFIEHKISTQHFTGTTGYGYDDIGRDLLAKCFATVFGGEKAIVSPHITCGSHAITICLYGLLRPKDSLLSITGMPYDTLAETITGTNGSLKEFGVNFHCIDYKDGQLDIESIKKTVKKLKPKVVFIQRSRGYNLRKPLSIDDIKSIIEIVKTISPLSFVLVDNCYGEFVEEKEPCQVGADAIVGSLIKNPGGGIAPTGGYIVGTERAIELIAGRLNSPSLLTEVGSFEQGYRLFFQGLFLSPSTVKNAIKGAYLLGEVMQQLGYKIVPSSTENAYDIIKSIVFNSEEELVAFVQQIQKYSPIDSHCIPFPWDMPGYSEKVIMAAGTFVSGASIEFSCDSPIKKPYVAYFQGGLTYEHIKIATEEIATQFLNKKQ